MESAKQLSASPWVIGDLEWDQSLKYGVQRNLRPGDILYTQGRVTEYFYYLKRGRVRVSICSQEGSEKTLAIQEAGSLLGETAAFDGSPCFSTAVATGASTVYAFTAAQFRQMVRENPDLSVRMLQSLGFKVRVLAAQVSSLAFMDARSRIAYLLSQACDMENQGSDIVNITHQDMANMTGLCRVTVTKVLNDLHRGGIIDKGRSRILVRDAGRLRQLMVNAP